MTKHKVGYLIGSLARESINRKLAKGSISLFGGAPGGLFAYLPLRG